ncbi:MAG: hypothetical protein Q4G23_01550 [Clostridia bacterium]|nr:hypothetical protein [Clostridia bacterium]
MKIATKIVSVIITVFILVKLISLLDFICFDFGIIGDIGWYIPGCILGFAGLALNFGICKKMCGTKAELFLFCASAFVCVGVVLLDLFIMYVISRI